MLKFDSESTLYDWCNKHRGTHNVKSVRLIYEPIRTVDVKGTLDRLNAGERRIAYKADTKYSCLSYAWANVDSWDIGSRPWPAESERWEVTSMSRSTLIDILRVCKSIGVKHIWIDALCIDQKSRIEKQQEIPRMGKIYQNADKVLVLWKNENENKVSDLLSPKWITRVWTFQEITMAGWERSGDKPILYIVRVSNSELCRFAASLCYALFVGSSDTEGCNMYYKKLMGEMYVDDEDLELLSAAFSIDESTHTSLIRKVGCTCTVRDRLTHNTQENLTQWLARDKSRHIVATGKIMNKVIPLCNISDHEVKDCPCLLHANCKAPHTHWKDMTAPSLHPECIDNYKIMTQLHNSQLLSTPDILRMVSMRYSTYEEDRVYGVMGLLGIETIRVEYGIGIRAAIGRLAAAMSVDQVILLSLVDRTAGMWPDGYCMVPKMIHPEPAWHFNVTKTLSQASFAGHSGMQFTGLTCIIGKVRAKDKERQAIGTDDCKLIVSRDTNYATESNDVVGYGFINGTPTDVHAILVGICDEKELHSITGVTSSTLRPNVVAVLCIDQGASLHKVGLAAVDAKGRNWSIKRCLVV